MALWFVRRGQQAFGFAMLVCLVVCFGDRTPAFAETLVVALGASNTAGKGVAPEDAYPAQLERLLNARGRRVKVQNAGVSGETTDDMLARLDVSVPDGTRLVILQPGGNDRRRRRGGDNRAGNIIEIENRLRARRIGTVLLENSMLHEIPDDMHQEDGQHLTPEGYRLLASRLMPEVLRALGR